MSFNLSLEFILAFAAQFVVVVSFFSSLRERVKRLEEERIKVDKKLESFNEKHELIAEINGKLDLLISQLQQK